MRVGKPNKSNNPKESIKDVPVKSPAQAVEAER